IDLAKLPQTLDDAAAEQAVIRMVVDHLNAEPTQQPVIGLGTGAFEGRVTGALPAHPVDDVVAFGMRLHHLTDQTDVVLQIGIYTDERVPLSGQQPGNQGRLVTPIARQLHTDHTRVAFRHVLDDGPGLVAAAIIDKVNRAVISYRTSALQCLQLLYKPSTC